MLPAFCYYDAAGGLAKVSHGYYNSRWMMGNLGFNKAVCVSDYVQLTANRTLGCEIGVMSKLTYAGIIPDNLPYDTSDDAMYYGFCGDAFDTSPPNGATYPPGTDTCTTDYLSPDLEERFNAKCAGQDECWFVATSYVDKASGYANNGTTPCTTNPAKVYLQY